MKQTIKRVVTTAVAIAFIVPFTVNAHDGSSSGNRGLLGDDGITTELRKSLEAQILKTTESLRQKVEFQRQTIEDRVQTKKVEVTQKLTDKKRKICETKQENINAVMATLANRRQSSIDRITKIFDAVQTFNTSHQLNPANYDDLVATANAAKTAAETAQAAQLAVPPFDCTGDHPRADLSDFKQKHTDSIEAVKNYRDAVKQLVKAVKAEAETSKDIS